MRIGDPTDVIRAFAVVFTLLVFVIALGVAALWSVLIVLDVEAIAEQERMELESCRVSCDGLWPEIDHGPRSGGDPCWCDTTRERPVDYKDKSK